MDICHYCQEKSNAAHKLDPKELEKMGMNCSQHSCHRGDRIMIQDSLSYNIVYIKEGLVKVHAKGPEREQILNIAKGPCYLGIPTIFGARINRYSATAISEASICYIGFDIFKDFVMENGQFAYEIIKELSENELRNYRRNINQLQKHGPGKVAEALLFFSNEIFESDHFKLPLTRNELGDFTGTSRESISRILTDFSRNGIIKVNKTNIRILEKEKLEKISEMG